MSKKIINSVAELLQNSRIEKQQKITSQDDVSKQTIYFRNELLEKINTIMDGITNASTNEFLNALVEDTINSIEKGQNALEEFNNAIEKSVVEMARSLDERAKSKQLKTVGTKALVVSSQDQLNKLVEMGREAQNINVLSRMKKKQIKQFAIQLLNTGRKLARLGQTELIVDGSVIGGETRILRRIVGSNQVQVVAFDLYHNYGLKLKLMNQEGRIYNLASELDLAEATKTAIQLTVKERLNQADANPKGLNEALKIRLVYLAMDVHEAVEKTAHARTLRAKWEPPTMEDLETLKDRLHEECPDGNVGGQPIQDVLEQIVEFSKDYESNFDKEVRCCGTKIKPTWNLCPKCGKSIKEMTIERIE